MDISLSNEKIGKLVKFALKSRQGKLNSYEA